MHVKNTLELLHDQLVDLSRTPSLNKKFDSYVADLVQTVDRVLKKYKNLPPAASREIMGGVWSATKYLIGSSSNEIPYEIVYALDLARSEWKKKECIITTALIDDQDYHYNVLSAYTGNLISYFLNKAINYDLIQIALPKLYKHKPLHIVALYHELGHFLADDLKIIATSLIFYPPKDPNSDEEKYHRSEFFADLFAACYTGHSLNVFLSNYFPDNKNSYTHPSSERRIKNIEAFLNKKPTPLIEMFEDILKKLKLPGLEKRYQKPDISKCFDNIRPYEIKNDKELHGILGAGWKYLKNILTSPSEKWRAMSEFERDCKVNDLIEKSIRNRLIKIKWNNETS